jgi:hypothetical protein
MKFDEVVQKMKDSVIFLAIYDSSYIDNPACAFQLGLAVALDKPMYLLIREGTPVPSNLKKVAKKIVFFSGSSEDEVKKAASELFDYAVKVEDNLISYEEFDA